MRKTEKKGKQSKKYEAKVGLTRVSRANVHPDSTVYLVSCVRRPEFPAASAKGGPKTCHVVCNIRNVVTGEARAFLE